MGGMSNDASFKSLKATQSIKWNVNNKKVGCLWCLSFNFYTLRNKNSTSENILSRKAFNADKKYLSNATQSPDSIKTCIFLMLLYLCFVTRKNYALIGSIISSIHTQNGFKHQQCIVKGVIHCHIRKFNTFFTNVDKFKFLNIFLYNFIYLSFIVIELILVLILKFIRLYEIINMIEFFGHFRLAKHRTEIT